MTMTVHTQAFMLEFGNILVKSGIRPDVAGQVVAKLHAYEAESGAYPNGHPYPTPTMYNFGGQMAATFAQGLVMLANIEKRTGNLKRIYGIGHAEFQRFISLTQTLHDHLLKQSVAQVWALNATEFSKLTGIAMRSHQSYKRAVEHYLMDNVAPIDSEHNGVSLY